MRYDQLHYRLMSSVLNSTTMTSRPRLQFVGLETGLKM